MLERRQHPRNRVYYGGAIAFNARNSTLDCIVRNFSPHGAKIEFDVVRRGLSCAARLAWRNQNAAGLLFCEEREKGTVVTLDWARKLRDSERTNRRLKSRLDQLLNEY